ncbi:hypothetical protein DCAR_0729017 [Daucus carota subsp. sativus]|uniref:Exonuclease domain-containing protein n=1 Tax=Daucus carota subsp. sativus TaxID=79200 RepID=A0AAF1B7Z9_DAUCS|nr:PREDICTED: exonuclease DPD1, chloroplastic/mitochondrial [Daucus carota subsp. sativus]WOH09560.1 hypothetical protein DCAR_0729017 [Daucus carota subsp. sativus]
MRTVSMCFSLLQVPRCRFHTLASSWWDNFHKLGRTGVKGSRLDHLRSNNSDLDGGHTRKYVRTVTTKTDQKRKSALNKKSEVVGHGMTLSSNELHTNKLEISTVERKDFGTQQKVTENKELAKLMTIIIFDIETTGFSRENERIIEIALQDLVGGENSTFQTLINPECYVPNSHIHGISTHMVSRPDVPRMKELIPILVEYIQSRQKPGGQVLWIGHNARSFDVPFLIKEFSRCSIEIPKDWIFMDTLPLARELVKSGGPNCPSKTSLQALREHYKIPLVGSAHRAMSDVYSLSLVLQRMTFDLKVPISGLLDRSFKASEVSIAKKKKSSR